MPRISEHFTNAYLRAEDLSSPLTATIDDIDEVTIADNDRIVIGFRETDKLLPLNKTNALTLAELFGDEANDWVGKVVELYKDKVMFQGKRVPAVRVRAARQQPQPQAGPSAREAAKAKAYEAPKF